MDKTDRHTPTAHDTYKHPMLLTVQEINTHAHSSDSNNNSNNNKQQRAHIGFADWLLDWWCELVPFATIVY